MIKVLIVFIGLSLFLLVSGKRTYAQEPMVDPARGEAIYQKHCLRCHGPNGEGNGPDASSLMVAPVNFQSLESRSKSDEELRSAIIWGFAFSPMHGWWDKLTREEIWSVIHYIRQLAPYQPEAQ
jgi:mono/diheme cytochrome c family protein